MIHIEADTADDLWRSCAQKLRSDEAAHTQASRAAPTREILHAALTVRDPQQHWIGSRDPVINPAFALAELVWIVNGSNEASFINYWNPALPKYCGQKPQYNGAYGHRLRRHFGFDQLERAYQALTSNPDSRQVVLQIWDATTDLPLENGKPADEDIPCNICAILKVRGSRLEWLQIVRSNDLFLGLPYNCVQFMSLQELLAGWLGLSVGPFEQVSDSLHVYERDIEAISVFHQSPIPQNSDSLALPRRECLAGFSYMWNAMQKMSSTNVGHEDLCRIVTEFRGPEAYRNMLAIIAAEAARRKEWETVADELLSRCSNLCLVHLWERWRARQCRARFDQVHPTPQAHAIRNGKRTTDPKAAVRRRKTRAGIT